MAPAGPTAAWTPTSRRPAAEPQASATRPLAAATAGGVRYRLPRLATTCGAGKGLPACAVVARTALVMPLLPTE